MSLKHLMLLSLVTAMFIPVSLMAAMFKYVDPNQNPKFEIAIGKGCAKILDLSDPDDYSVFNSKTATMIAVDKRRGEFYEFNEQQMKTIGQRVKSHQKDLLAQLQQMPGLTDEQRKKMAQAFQQMGKAPPSSPSTRKRRIEEMQKYLKVNGTRCRVINVYQGETVERQLCVATRDAVGISKADYDVVLAMNRFMKKMAETAKKEMGTSFGPDAYAFGISGVPVQMKNMRDGSVVQLSEVSSRPPSKNPCTIPSNLKRADPIGGIPMN